MYVQKQKKRGVRGGSVDLGGNGSKYTNDMGWYGPYLAPSLSFIASSLKSVLRDLRN